MNYAQIAKALEKYPSTQVQNYCVYIHKLITDKKRDGSLQNPWMQYKSEKEMIRLFKTVASDGLVFDGDDITLQSTGVSYSYQALKNKMLLAYPESLVDVGIVYQKDKFSFKKESGKVEYTHDINDPFGHEEKDIIGAYCVIKNSRGEFLTTLSRKEIDKHRNVAKTDYIWKSWFSEMTFKTVLKKACKQHFKDTYKNIEILDNENYDLEKLTTTEQVESSEGLKATKKFLKKMKEMKKDYPDAYNEVMDTWKDDGKDLDPAKITNLQTQKDIVNDITSRIGKAA